MKKLIISLLMLLPLALHAQRIELYTDERGNEGLAVYAYGLQRNIVNTNDEMRASVNESGITRRHHTTKGEENKIGDEGYIANDKISFAFVVAPYNVTTDGSTTSSTEWSGKLSWATASGWDTSLDSEMCAFVSGNSGEGVGESTVADTPTGCAAYQGIDGKDPKGSWRLPTQRELQVMFTLTDQALMIAAQYDLQMDIPNGEYWTSTEFFASGSTWNVWLLDNTSGKTLYKPRSTYEVNLTRCVKDIFLPINEK